MNSPARYDSGLSWDSGARWDMSDAEPKPKKPMAKVKLSLDAKSDADLIAFGQAHTEAMNGNANFPTPEPDAAAFDAATAAFQALVDNQAATDAAARAATAATRAGRVDYENAFRARAVYVDTASGGDEAKILSSGFDLRGVPTAVGDLPAPTGFLATMGDMPGEIDLVWDPVRGANVYLIECKKHTDAESWQFVKPVTASKATLDGMESGVEYAFRVAAVGAAGQGPWSDESVKRVP